MDQKLTLFLLQMTKAKFIVSLRPAMMADSFEIHVDHLPSDTHMRRVIVSNVILMAHNPTQMLIDTITFMIDQIHKSNQGNQ